MTSELIFSSVENIPGVSARAAFTVNSAAVFREDCDIMPSTFGNIKYMPWGADNQMPYNIIDLIERDETLATCQIFNAEICYGSGLVYDTSETTAAVADSVEDFLLDNDLASYFLGVCQDFKHFGFAVSVIILNAEGTKVVRLLRKEACYCRFAVADKSGRIPQILYANWRKYIPNESDVEVIELLDPSCPWRDLQDRLAKRSKCRKFAVLTRVPTTDSTYYPIPHYGSLLFEQLQIA